MIKFVKDSIRELKHVVWPTRSETNNYFLTVVIVLILFWLYLFIASTVFTKSLFGLKDLVNPNIETTDVVIPKWIISNEASVKIIEAKTNSWAVKIVAEEEIK
jgi:preprotein translocase SecE subunit